MSRLVIALIVRGFQLLTVLIYLVVASVLLAGCDGSTFTSASTNSLKLVVFVHSTSGSRPPIPDSLVRVCASMRCAEAQTDREGKALFSVPKHEMFDAVAEWGHLRSTPVSGALEQDDVIHLHLREDD